MHFKDMKADFQRAIDILRSLSFEMCPLCMTVFNFCNLKESEWEKWIDEWKSAFTLL
jgi:hypothetical protein